MKSRSLSLSTVALALLACLSSFSTRLAPQSHAQAPQSLRTQITLSDDRRQVGILINSSEQGIAFALQEGAQASQIPYTGLKAVDFPDAGQYMQTARNAYLAGDWEMAEASMAQIADAFPQAAMVANSFATEARYYQIDSLRRLGRYSDIGRLFATPTGKAMEFALNDVFDQQVALLRLWAFYGAGNIAQLGTELEAYFQPQVGDTKMLPDAQFRDGIAENDLVQLAFLRGKVNEAAGKTAQALEDYYRAFTLTHANRNFLANEAMSAAMKLHAADADVNDKPTKLWALQSVAFVYKNVFNKGDIDASLADYAVKPELPQTAAPAKASEEPPAAPAPEKPADAGEKPAEPAAAK